MQLADLAQKPPNAFARAEAECGHQSPSGPRPSLPDPAAVVSPNCANHMLRSDLLLQPSTSGHASTIGFPKLDCVHLPGCHADHYWALSAGDKEADNVHEDLCAATTQYHVSSNAMNKVDCINKVVILMNFLKILFLISKLSICFV